MIARRFATAGLVAMCASIGALTLGSASALAVKEYVPGGSFGSEGSGDGQFIEPAGVAVNNSTEPLTEPAAGEVYVVDKGNARIERLTSAGAYVAQFDGSGTPAGSFSAPEEIAVDNSASPWTHPRGMYMSGTPATTSWTGSTRRGNIWGS